MDSPDAEEGQQRRYQTFRSNASSNWRVKDDSPRVESQPRTQQRGERSERGAFNPRHGNGNPQQQSQDAAPSSRLYVGNLLYSAQSKDVEELFTENGFTVAQINMSTDPFTGRNPSYCFVDLENADEAARAMGELNGKDVLGRAVRINPGVAKKSGFSNREGREGREGQNRYDRGEQSSREPRTDNYKPTFDRWSRNDASEHFKGVSEQGRRLYVGGLPRMEPQSTVDAEIQKIFDGFELQTVSKIISPHPSKASEPGEHHYLFVDFATYQEAENAMRALDGKEMEWGSALRVSKAKGDSRKQPREQWGGRGGQEARQDES